MQENDIFLRKARKVVKNTSLERGKLVSRDTLRNRLILGYRLSKSDMNRVFNLLEQQGIIQWVDRETYLIK